MCLYKADTYISTNLSRYIDGFHIQMVFNQVRLVWQQLASSKIPPCCCSIQKATSVKSSMQYVCMHVCQLAQKYVQIL